MAFVFLGSLCVVVCYVMDACLLLLCLFQFFSTKARDWLGRTAPKCPILCQVGCKTLTRSVMITVTHVCTEL